MQVRAGGSYGAQWAPVCRQGCLRVSRVLDSTDACLLSDSLLSAVDRKFWEAQIPQYQHRASHLSTVNMATP